MNIKNKILSWLMKKEDHAEAVIINQWKNEAKNNLKHLSLHVDPDVYIDNLKDYKKVDKSKAWDQIQSKTKNDVGSARRYALRKIAAILVITLISLAGVWTIIKKSPEMIEYVAKTQVSEHTLKDGTLVTLDRESTLKMIKNRELSLSGRGYFAVAKNPELPFRVSMHHGILEVLGTQFVIFTTEDYTSVYVHEGKVKIQYNGQYYVLEASDKIVMSKDEVKTSKIPEINPKSWVSNQLVFKDKTLNFVLNALAIHYNLSVVYPENVSETDNCKINSSFKDISIKEALDELSLISGLEYRLSQNKVVILGFKC